MELQGATIPQSLVLCLSVRYSKTALAAYHRMIPTRNKDLTCVRAEWKEPLFSQSSPWCHYALPMGKKCLLQHYLKF